MMRTIIILAVLGSFLLGLNSSSAPLKAETPYLATDFKGLKVDAASKEIQTIAPGSVESSKTGQSRTYYLVGNLKDVRGEVVTDKGASQTSFSGEIAFQIRQDEKGALTMNLWNLNLLSPGVETGSGSSGVIGLNLQSPPYEVSYDQRTGSIYSQFGSTLHYALIDELKGFIPGGGEEQDVFYSYTETMSGNLKGKLSENLLLKEGGTASLEGEVNLVLDDSVLGSIRSMRVVLSIRDLWMAITEPAEVLKVQPVFIGSGPDDPTATGIVYATLIRRAADIWNRCGAERCLTLRSNDPIYIDEDDYRTIGGGWDAIDSGESEAYDLMDEVNVLDAVEVFVVDRWDPYCDGGGATWSSGTASAKIVTCDQQLDVPCPPPSSVCSGGSCGDVNYCHLAHELGHALDLTHPGEIKPGRPEGSAGSVLEPSGFCRDNPDAQSAHNCREASNPLLFWSRSICTGSPDISD